MTSPSRFIVFRPGALGDTLAAAPTLWALATRFPDARIEYLAKRHPTPGVVTAAEVLALIPEVDRSHLYDDRLGWLARLRQIRRQIKPRDDDVLLYLCYRQPNRRRIVRDWLFFFLAGFRRFAGFKTALRDAAPIDRGITSEYQRLLDAANASGLDLVPNVSGQLRGDDPWGAQFWRDHELEGRPVVAVCPGSKMQSKRWLPERFAEVITRLSRRDPEVAFVMLGTEADRAVIDAIHRQAAGRLVDAVGLPLPRVCALLMRAHAYLGNDTGPMHIAALLGRPCVAIFSSRDRAGKWSPWGEGHTVFRTEIRCAGCMLETCFANPAECLAGISVDAVERAVGALVAKRSCQRLS